MVSRGSQRDPRMFVPRRRVCHVSRTLYYIWTRWDGEHKGKCVDVNALAFVNGGVRIALDLVTLALPISQIRSLQLGLRKKIFSGAMLSVGLM